MEKFVVFLYVLRDMLTGAIREKKDKLRGRFGPLQWLLKNVLGLCPALAEVHVWSVNPKQLKKAEWRDNVMTPTIDIMTAGKECVLHCNNQTKWSAVHHPGWTRGTAAGMDQLFTLNTSKPFEVALKCYKRISTLMLADTKYYIAGEDLDSLRIRHITKADVYEFYYRLTKDVNKAEELTQHVLKATDGLAAILSKSGMKKLTRRQNWTNGQVLGGWRYAMKGVGISKGDAMYVANLRGCDMVVYDWNITNEVFPNFDMLRVTGAEEVQERTRTDWQSMVYFSGLRQWYPLIVKMRYKEIIEKTGNFSEMVEALRQVKLEKVGPDFEEESYEDDELLNEIKNLTQALPLMGEELALALKSCASKIVRLFGGGNSQRRKIEAYSCPYPEGWALRASIKPDIACFNSFGMFDLTKAALGEHDVYCGQIEDGVEVFTFRWPIGSRKSHVIKRNHKAGYYATNKVAAGTVFVNVHTIREYLARLDGGDNDDHATMIVKPEIVKTIKEGLLISNPLEECLPDLEWFQGKHEIIPPSDKKLTWKNIMDYRIGQFKSGDVVTVGMFVYMCARFQVFSEHLEMFESGDSGKKYFPQAPYNSHLSDMPFPHQRWDFIPIDGFKKGEPYMVSYFNFETGTWDKIPLRDLVEWFKDNMGAIRCLTLSNADGIKNDKGENIIYSEIVIDLANMKGEKYFLNGRPCPAVIRIQESILGVFQEGLPGPKGKWSRGGLKTYLPEIDDPLYGRMGNPDILFSGKKGKASEYTDGHRPVIVGRQWFTGTIQNGEWVKTWKTPREITADLIPNGWKFSHVAMGDLDELACNIKLQVMHMDKAKEEGELDSIFRGIFSLAIEENARYYEQPLVYDVDPSDRYHFLNDYKTWLEETYGDELIVEREFAMTEGAIAIARRYDAELLNLLWQKWQELGGRKPHLLCEATEKDRSTAASLMYRRWLSGLTTVVYHNGREDAGKETKSLFQLLVDKYGDPNQYLNNPMNAPFADKIDWSDATALTEEFLGHFCKWAKDNVELR